MADSRQFLELASGASGILTKLASIPSGADNAIIRVDAGTVRLSESSGSWLNASIGIMFSTGDQAFRIGNGIPLTGFAFVPLGGAAAIQISYYSYHGIGQYL
ncbi:MAG TPA: hypothetical protein VNN25_28450 [Thermoanaerobaculia bacterium]|nr:hypothetical protein [Thermoanaerobaculia bacterium]